MVQRIVVLLANTFRKSQASVVTYDIVVLEIDGVGASSWKLERTQYATYVIEVSFRILYCK